MYYNKCPAERAYTVEGGMMIKGRFTEAKGMIAMEEILYIIDVSCLVVNVGLTCIHKGDAYAISHDFVSSVWILYSPFIHRLLLKIKWPLDMKEARSDADNSTTSAIILWLRVTLHRLSPTPVTNQYRSRSRLVKTRGIDQFRSNTENTHYIQGVLGPQVPHRRINCSLDDCLKCHSQGPMLSVVLVMVMKQPRVEQIT